METAWTNTPSDSFRPFVRNPLITLDKICQPTRWFAIVFLAFVFLQWRFNHAHAKEPWHALADVVRQHRYEHACTLLETACQEAAKVRDYRPVLQRFLCQPT